MLNFSERAIELSLAATATYRRWRWTMQTNAADTSSRLSCSTFLKRHTNADMACSAPDNMTVSHADFWQHIHQYYKSKGLPS